MFREDPVGEAEGKTAAATGKALGALDLLVVADIAFTESAAFAQAFVPLTSFDQMEGIFVNFEGRAQRLNQAIFPQGEVWPAWKVAGRLMELFGGTAPWNDYPGLVKLLKEQDGFAELDTQALFRHGSSLRALPGEPVPQAPQEAEAALHE